VSGIVSISPGGGAGGGETGGGAGGHPGWLTCIPVLPATH